jgi:hypothetical protein
MLKLVVLGFVSFLSANAQITEINESVNFTIPQLPRSMHIKVTEYFAKGSAETGFNVGLNGGSNFTMMLSKDLNLLREEKTEESSNYQTGQKYIQHEIDVHDGNLQQVTSLVLAGTKTTCTWETNITESMEERNIGYRNGLY